MALCACGCGGEVRAGRSFITRHNLKFDPRRLQTDDQRLWSRFRQDGDCLIWQGRRLPNGYGMVWWPGRGKVYVHRLVFELTHGHPPENDVCHTCDRPGCGRPDHLFDGTPVDNAADMVRKGRYKKTGLKGARHHQAKIDDAAVRDIRERYVPWSRSSTDLAQQYGISGVQVRKIARGVAWGHVE